LATGEGRGSTGAAGRSLPEGVEPTSPTRATHEAETHLIDPRLNRGASVTLIQSVTVIERRCIKLVFKIPLYKGGYPSLPHESSAPLNPVFIIS